MLEILGTKYCGACMNLKRRLEKEKIPHTFVDAFNWKDNERGAILTAIGAAEGYTYHPMAFYKEECLGEGHSVLNRIHKLGIK